MVFIGECCCDLSEDRRDKSRGAYGTFLDLL